MTRTVYLNGAFCPEQDAKVSIFDRGLLFADAVYEVVGVLDGKLLDFAGHMGRLDRSLGELAMNKPLSTDEILAVQRKLVAANGLGEGLVYLQITRGVADRDFVPPDDPAPTVFMFTQAKPAAETRKAETGVALKSVPDQRWARRDIKTVGLLAQVLAKQAAKDAGAYEALMVQDGVVTEGGATSAYIVKNGAVITRPLSNAILPGVTRASLLELVRVNDIRLDERPFTLEEAYAADEAFITGASTYVCPVVEIDGRPLGSGKPGPIVRQLQQIYMTHARAGAI
ncbi:MAG: D-amino-acid transaminase [Rhodospirillales bacterium]|nr:D-amino-acid transaminase [Rhodospirillales bacterium]